MAVLERLETITDLTYIEKEIKAYILNHLDQMIEMNIADLANETESSNATIIRFCRKLNVTGYKEFKLELVKDIERRRKEKKDIDMSYPFSRQESSQQVFKKMLDLSKESLDSCYEAISSRDLNQIAKWINEANNVYLYGVGDSMISAMSFANRLVKLGKHAIIANQYGDSAANIYQVTRRDLVIVVSYSGSSIPNKKFLKMMKRIGCKTVLLSSNQELDDFDLKIIIPNKEDNRTKFATYYSQICFNFIFNTLYALVFNLDYKANLDKKNTIDYNL